MKEKEYDPIDCQGCGEAINNGEGGLCFACSSDNYDEEMEMKADLKRKYKGE